MNIILKTRKIGVWQLYLQNILRANDHFDITGEAHARPGIA